MTSPMTPITLRTAPKDAFKLNLSIAAAIPAIVTPIVTIRPNDLIISSNISDVFAIYDDRFPPDA